MVKKEEKPEPIAITTIAGNIGRVDPRKTTSKGDVVNFSVAVNETTDKDAEAKWVRVAVWNERIIDQAEKLKKGNRVVVQGRAYEKEFNGKTQYEMTAYRIGLVEYLRPQDPSTATHEEEVGW